MSSFEKLSKIDVSKHIEKKGRFSYLSWPFAVSELRKADPTAAWEVMRFDGNPFMQTSCGCFVEVAVTVDGVTLSQIHPVLNNQNKPIPEPSSFDINTSIQRCLVKAIALHGLGLCIYAGEDLPLDDYTTPESQQLPKVSPQAPPKPSAAEKRAKDIKELLNAAGSLEQIQKTASSTAAERKTWPGKWQTAMDELIAARITEFKMST